MCWAGYRFLLLGRSCGCEQKEFPFSGCKYYFPKWELCGLRWHKVYYYWLTGDQVACINYIVFTSAEITTYVVASQKKIATQRKHWRLVQQLTETAFICYGRILKSGHLHSHCLIIETACFVTFSFSELLPHREMLLCIDYAFSQSVGAWSCFVPLVGRAAMLVVLQCESHCRDGTGCFTFTTFQIKPKADDCVCVPPLILPVSSQIL